ncbi:MAG: ABC transporter permease subunit [Defluviitaleaceae bacterium]|nr:ABC transporter permease subunit [Defluviitaleaceae bacterium]
MLLLPIVFFVIFRYWPMINMQIAFRENNFIQRIWDVPWVGMDNFERAVNHPPFRNAFRNTIVFSVLDIAAGFPAPIILALLLNELKFRKFKRITQTISYMPHFLSWIIISGLAISLLSPTVGTVNVLLGDLFNIGPIPFLNEDNWWIGTVVTLGVWRSVGWNTIIYLAAITSVNPELYEAADMDGASRLRKMWHVTLPGIRPVIIILFILALGGVMAADFDRFLALRNPLVANVSDVLPLYIWQWGLQRWQFAMATAVGIMQNTINLALLLTANFVVRRLGGDGLW